MFRTGLGFACFALVGALVGCTTDVEDPGVVSASGMPASSSDSDDVSSSSTTADASGTTVTDETTGKAEGTAASVTTDDPTTDGGSDTTADSGAAGCGDGVVSPGEQCDGTDLQNLDCAALGLGTGTLGCDPVMCTFDTSMCMSDTGGTSG